jgi:hypothetical protein
VDAPTGTPGAVGLRADDFLTGANPRRFVARLATLLAGGGICLGTVTFYDAPTWAQDRFGTGVTVNDGSPDGPLGQLSTLSAEPPGIVGPRLPVFLVPRLLPCNPNTGTCVVGVDGTIPGPATVNGTVRSGAAVSMEDLLFETAPGVCASPVLDLRCGADRTAYVAAHEIGHFLGLYHVTESTGAHHDPFTDTPRCVCDLCNGPSFSQFSCSDSRFVLSQRMCTQGVEACSGGRNLMFWLLGDPVLTQGILSPDQGRVMRTSPVVRPSP